MHSTRVALVATLLILPGGMLRAQEVPVIGLPCEGCEAVFEGMPRDIPFSSRIAHETEPGERMVIEGTVFDADGDPAAGIILYAYHTDTGGVYPKDETMRGTASYRHGRLRGWAKTDSAGHYQFRTIRPGGYPTSSIPAHVHMHVIEPGRCTYYIASIEFEDDPRLLEEHREDQEQARGGSGLVSPVRDSGGQWALRRDVILGLNVPDYQECDR